MTKEGIAVIATTISGSIKDWGKIDKIIPQFKNYGRSDVSLHVVDSHAEARKQTFDLLKSGSRILISAGGSGTFNSVLEGCIDSGIGLAKITLGFLRKGSADLIGKSLGMPDDVGKAAEVFVTSLAENRTVRCDVIQAVSGEEGSDVRHFVGYGGAEIFGRIPFFSENRFIKYYKGVLGQLFGDRGPFFVAAALTVMEKIIRRKRTRWSIWVDGKLASEGKYQAMVIVNGDLGPDLPFAKAVPLGSGDFHMSAIKDLGMHKLVGQFKRAWDSSIVNQSEKWGYESYRIKKELKIEPDRDEPFPVNVDGSSMKCRGSASFRIIDQINLISKS